MEILIASGVNGLVLSSMYILVALGFALLLSIMGIFNFAHGAIYMIGAYITYIFSVQLGFNQWFAFILSIIIVGLFGIFLERYCFRPFQNDSNNVIVMAVALVFILEATVNVTLGGEVRALPQFVPGILKVGVVSTSWERFITLIIGVVLLTILTLLINRTQIGQQMLAVAQDKVGATLQGIDINRTAAIATVLACMMAAIAGSLMAALLSMSPYMGDNILVKGIQVVILSGIGSVGGIFFGGLIIGFLDGVLPVFTDSALAQAVSLGIIIIVLLVRPKGLFGYELF